MILITGAAGKTGLALCSELTHQGQPVRALVRRPDQIETTEAVGAVEALVGDMADPADVRAAMAGVTAVYHICPNMHPQEVAIAENVIGAAQAEGNVHFVYHSVLHPQIEAMPHHWLKMRVEERLFTAGLPFTVLQPAAYMQNVMASWQLITRQGIYQVPYPVQTRLGMVDLQDVAGAAAAVLTQPGHKGAIYELVGPQNLTQVEVADILAEMLGRPVRAEEQPLADWQIGAESSGLGSYQVDTLLKMFSYYAAYDFGGSDQVLRHLLGRPPATFADFVKRSIK